MSARENAVRPAHASTATTASTGMWQRPVCAPIRVSLASSIIDWPHIGHVRPRPGESAETVADGVTNVLTSLRAMMLKDLAASWSPQRPRAGDALCVTFEIMVEGARGGLPFAPIVTALGVPVTAERETVEAWLAEAVYHTADLAAAALDAVAPARGGANGGAVDEAAGVDRRAP